MRITIKIGSSKYYVFTEWPLLQQLSAIGATIKLTANNPYPCFMVSWATHTFLFTQKGERVATMLGFMGSYSFDDIVDIREVIPNLYWDEGWA